MWPPVAVTDLESRWRPLSDAEKTIATQRLKDAETVLQFQLRERGLATPPAGDVLWGSLYQVTVVEIARRYLLNPEAWLEVTDRLDDWSETRRRDSSVSAGLLYVTDEEIAKLLPTGRRKRGAFSIALGWT